MSIRKNAHRQKRYLKITFKRIISQPNISPHLIAMGFAVGIFIGLGPTFGFQMIPAFFICTLLGYHKIMGTLAVWVSNPLTVVPIYLFNFQIGQWTLIYLFDRKATSIVAIESFFHHPTWKSFISLGGDAMQTFLLGSLLVASVGAVIGYFLMKWTILYLRRRAEKKLTLKLAQKLDNEKPSSEPSS